MPSGPVVSFACATFAPSSPRPRRSRLDEEARTQLKELQVSLTARLEHLRTQWNAKLEAAIETKNVKEALALVARPPDMSTRVSAEMAAKVVAITSEALSADADPTLWKEIVALDGRHVHPSQRQAPGHSRTTSRARRSPSTTRAPFRSSRSCSA